MAAAAATEAPPPGGTTFAFAGGAGPADDFRQQPEGSEGHFKVADGESSPTAATTRQVAVPVSSEAAAAAPPSTTHGAPTCPTAAAAAPDAASPPASASSAATAAAANAASLPGAGAASANSPPTPVLPLSPGETALLEFRKVTRKYCDEGVTEFFMPAMTEEDLDQFGWQEALRITVDPHPWTLPTEALSYKPTPDEIHKFFFKNTPHEVCIRQIFFHVPLSVDEQQWLQQFRQKCTACNWTIPFFLEPHVLRLVWFCKRKYPEDAINKSLEHAQLMVEWRRQLYPICDAETELRKLLDMGVMYWIARDVSLRPLLVIRLSRLPKTTPPELFKRLTIFCFEWSLRFLMVPGVVETCVVLFDVRTVPLHQFPISALTDMVTTLTKQFPFRLHRMLVINDSFFVQTAWNIVKQFLTDVQQKKISFYRTGFETELLKEYTPHQLEKHYGGSREVTEFYPFPLAPGPFAPASVSTPVGNLGFQVSALCLLFNVHTHMFTTVHTREIMENVDEHPPPRTTTPAVPAWKASDRYTAFGVIWENSCRVPLQWADGKAAKEVFRAAGLPLPPPPITLQDEKMARALEAVEKATLAQRTSGILSYKTITQRLSTIGRKPSQVGQGRGDGLGDAMANPGAIDASVPHRTETLGLVGTEISKRLSTVQYTPTVSGRGLDAVEATVVAAEGSGETAGRAGAAPEAAVDASQDSIDCHNKADTADVEPPSSTTNLSVRRSFPTDAPVSEVQAHEGVSGGQPTPLQQHEDAVRSRQGSKEASVDARKSGVEASLQPVEKVRAGLCCKKCWVG